LEPLKAVGSNGSPRAFTSRNTGVAAAAQLCQGKILDESGGRPTVFNGSNSHRLQGVPYYDYAREPTPLPPPVATLFQIIDYHGTLV
jgi:hypothetical protein